MYRNLLLVNLLTASLILSACSNTKTHSDESSGTAESSTPIQIEDTTKHGSMPSPTSLNIPTKSSPEAAKLIGRVDNKLASIIHTIGKLERKEMKLSPTIEANVNQSINDMQSALDQLASKTDQLSESDYKFYERSIENLKDYKNKLEEVKQSN